MSEKSAWLHSELITQINYILGAVTLAVYVFGELFTRTHQFWAYLVKIVCLYLPLI